MVGDVDRDGSGGVEPGVCVADIPVRLTGRVDCAAAQRRRCHHGTQHEAERGNERGSHRSQPEPHITLPRGRGERRVLLPGAEGAVERGGGRELGSDVGRGQLLPVLGGGRRGLWRVGGQRAETRGGGPAGVQEAGRGLASARGSAAPVPGSGGTGLLCCVTEGGIGVSS